MQIENQHQPVKPQTFVSAINGNKFDVYDPMIASLLNSNEKKEIIHKAANLQPVRQSAKPKPKNETKDSKENELEIG